TPHIEIPFLQNRGCPTAVTGFDAVCAISEQRLPGRPILRSIERRMIPCELECFIAMRMFSIALVLGLFIAPGRAGHLHSFAGRNPADQGAREVQRYLRVVATRNANPPQFDRAHPFYGFILTHKEAFDALVARWQSHPARFEYWHPVLWHVLDGGQ